MEIDKSMKVPVAVMEKLEQYLMKNSNLFIGFGSKTHGSVFIAFTPSWRKIGYGKSITGAIRGFLEEVKKGDVVTNRKRAYVYD